MGDGPAPFKKSTSMNKTCSMELMKLMHMAE